MSNEKETEDNTIFSKIIKLQSCDGETFVVESDVVSMCATVKNMLNGKSAFRNSLGGQFSIDGSYVILKKEGRVLATLMKNSEEEAVVSLPEVKASILQKVIEYCKFHNNPNLTEREKKLWDSEFVQVKQNVLCDLASASYYLDIRPLVNLTSRAIATQISGKTSEEIRETFCNINYEVYAPMFASSLATRCRLQRKINRKKQTPQEQAREMKALPPPENDNRSVDELLQFIGENNANNTTNHNSNSSNNMSSLPTVPVQKKKSKKSKKKKKNQKEESSEKKEMIPKQDEQGKSNSNSSSSKEEEDDDDLDEFYEEKQEVNGGGDNTIWGEEDEDMDPEIKAALDKEVEDFRQRLESMHSLSKSNSKIPLPVTAASFVSSLVGVH